MTVSWCFSQPQLERALSSVWPWQAWIIRRFLHSTLAAQNKLRVLPSQPSGDATQHQVQRVPLMEPSDG